VARRRLRDAEPLGRARHVALGEQRVERHHEVEVHGREAIMNVVHAAYAYHQFG